jgi:Fe2+ or Zn2+ uptake regulation protein
MPSEQGTLYGINRLLEKKYRLTPQRKSVLLALANTESGEHPSAEEIYRTVKEYCPKIGLATVYRTLDLFANLSIVQTLVLEDGCVRYELKRNITHYHLICLSCGKILENDCMGIEPQLSESTGFKVTSAVIQFFGYCEKCRPKN